MTISPIVRGVPPRMQVDTSEEWVLYNCSISLWSHTSQEKIQAARTVRFALSRLPARARGRAGSIREGSGVPDHDQGRGSSVPHPRNPCWVTRIDLPDEHGRLHNILIAPRWMDTVSIPRGGRVVFRSRFADYVGMWENHCHILMHEDHGMMQAVETVPRAADANYRTRTRVASHTMSADDVSAIYPPPSLDGMYRQSMSFVDSHPDLGQVFPGFTLEVPRLA